MEFKIKLIENKFILVANNDVYNIDKEINNLIIEKFSKIRSIYDSNDIKYSIDIVEDIYVYNNNKLAEMMGLRIDMDEDSNYIYWNPSLITSKETKELILNPDINMTFKKMKKLDKFAQEVYKDCLVDWKPHEDWGQLMQIMKINKISTVYDFDIQKQYDVVLIRLFG